MKKKKNGSVSFIFVVKAIVFLILFFLLAADMYNFTETDASKSAKIFQLSQAVGKNETSQLEIDQEHINSILNAKVKYIEFSDSKKFDWERNIVYKVKNMAESEKYSEGSMKKAIIRIALEDLNGDGIKEILAYIVQFEWCGKGGGRCTFIVFQKSGTENWKELFMISTYPDIGIANTKNHGYRDIFLRNIVFRVIDKQKVRDKEEIIAWRWDGKRYTPYLKKEITYNPATKIEKKTLMKWDIASSSWMVIDWPKP